MTTTRSAGCLIAPILLVVALGGGCPPDDDGEKRHVEVVAECDNLAPQYCMLPWPSSRYLEADPSTETGWRVAYPPEAFPLNIDEDPFDTTAYARQDGFPPSAQIITLFPEPIDPAGLPGHHDYGASLLDDSPTVLLDLQTGERVAHFAETDVRHEDPAEVLLYIRPAQRLAENRRYGVAIRDVTYVDGDAPEPSPVFAALRDGVVTDSAQVEARRPRFEELFEALAEAGVERDSLIQAWDFHTASGGTLRGDLLFMRDDAMARVGPGGLGCTVTSVTEDYGEHTARLIEGTFTVPRYTEEDYGPGLLVRGTDGNPEYQGEMEVAFMATVPPSLLQPGAAPARVVQFGHGFFMTRDEMLHGYMQAQADEQGLVLFGANWDGMSTHDIGGAAAALADLSEFPTITERVQQSIVNNLVLTRTFVGQCLADEAFETEAVIETDDVYFYGISMGGIIGGAAMALSQDVERVAFSVTAGNFPVLEGRSINFDEFEIIYGAWYDSRLQREFYWSVMGHLWETCEAGGYSPFLTQDPLPDTPPKKVLYQLGMGDAQVANLGSDMIVRNTGIPQLLPANHEIWGVDEAPSTPYDGSAALYFDCGVPAPPDTNQAPADNSAHGCVRQLSSAQAQIDAFFRPDGEVIFPCDGACDPD